MKKTLIAFLCTFIALPAVADNYIKFKASAIEDTINTMVPETYRGAAADEYQKQMDSTTGKISVMGIYKVCAAAGFNINNTNGYNGCRLFINTIAEKSGFGSDSATQQNCRTKFNGIWTVTTDGIEQCVGKDGHKLVYHASCDGADGDCIRDFSSLQTQEPNAREFIQAYGQQKNLQFTCWYTYDNRRGITSPLGQDYIKCSAGGKAYEFEFDGLIQDPGKTAVESENTALCEMFGGKIVKHPDSSIEKQWQSCEVSREICNGPLHNLAVKIGHNVMYQGYCRLSRTVKETSIVGLKTLPGVDSRVFYNTGAQMRASMAKEQTEEYLRTKFPNETYINCDPNPKILNAGFGIDRDYVMTCTVGSKQVDFIFHDLTEGADYKAESGEAKMACAIVAERVNGKNCHGLDQAACTDLDNKLKQMGRRGTDYKPEQGGCILLDTQNEELVNLGLEIAGGVVLTVLTGGSGYVAIAVVASIATDIGFEQLNQWLRKIPYNDYQEFMEHANKCSDTDTSIENQYCVADVLNTYHALIMGSLDELAPEYQSQALEKLENMKNILSNNDIISKVSLDKIPTLKEARNYISIATLGVLFIVNPDKLANKADNLIRQGTNLGNETMKKLVELRRIFGSRATLRTSSTLNKPYFRISINNNESDIKKMIETLEKNGYYVSSNTTVGGERFLAASHENIFADWDNSPSNWLKHAERTKELPTTIIRSLPTGISENIKKIFTDAEKAYTRNIGFVNTKYTKSVPVYLTPIPTSYGTLTPIQNISGRSVVVVNVDSHKIPFYVSSGMAGKDKYGIPSGVWYPLAGISRYGDGWFNKMPNMLDNPIPQLDEIVNMLQRHFPAETLKHFAMNNAGCFGEIPYSAYDVINSLFPNGVVSRASDVSKYKVEHDKYYKNVQTIIDIFQ